MNPDSILLSAESHVGTGSYRFVCPACLEPVEKRADQKVVDLLRSVGVRFADGETGTLPFHGPADQRFDGPPFTYDDLLAFHFLLEDDDRLAELLFAPHSDAARDGSGPPS